MKTSVSHIPSIAAQLYNGPTHSSATCHILREDLYTGIMPFNRIDDHVKLGVTQGDPDTIRSAVALAFDREASPFQVSETIATFIRDAAHAAVLFGASYYELSLDGLSQRNHRTRLKHEQIPEDLTFSVDSIMPMSIFKVFGRLIQRLPAEDSPSRRTRLIVLDAHRTFEVNLPGISARNWMHILKKVAEVDKASLRVELLQSPGFELEAQQAIIREAELLLTNIVPWVHGNFTPKAMSEIYFVDRWLRMQGFIFSLRELITDVINRILRAAGESKGFCASVELLDLPTRADIDSAVRLLRAGEVGAEIMDRFLKAAKE